MPTSLWTDGSCPANPGPGGWAAILVHVNGEGVRTVKSLAGGVPGITTNNRMELLAVTKGLEALRKPSALTVHTDSRYVMDAFEKDWVGRWEGNGWRTRDRKPVSNVDLWQPLAEQVRRHVVAWVHVRGHRGVPLNERADRLAALAVPMDRRSAQRLADLERDMDDFLAWAH